MVVANLDAWTIDAPMLAGETTECGDAQRPIEESWALRLCRTAPRTTPLRDLSIHHRWILVRGDRWEIARHRFDGSGGEESPRSEDDHSPWLGWPLADVARRLLGSDDMSHRSVGQACLKAAFGTPELTEPNGVLWNLAGFASVHATCVVGIHPEAEDWKRRGWPVTILPAEGDWSAWGPELFGCELVVAAGSLLDGNRLTDLVGRTPSARARVIAGTDVPASPALFGMGFHGMDVVEVADPSLCTEYMRRGGGPSKLAPEGAFKRKSWFVREKFCGGLVRGWW